MAAALGRRQGKGPRCIRKARTVAFRPPFGCSPGPAYSRRVREETAMQTSAAVFRRVHEPLTIETVDLDRPRGREVLVRTVATGVCHSDLHVVDGLGRFPTDRPMVLGHEGA